MAPVAALAALLALSVELAGAALGWPLGARLAVAFAAAALAGGAPLVRSALDPGLLRVGAAVALPAASLAALVLPSVALTLGLGSDWVGTRLPAGPQSVGLLLTLVVSGPLTEELLHRGLIQRSLARVWGAGPAGLISAAGFTAAHELAGAGAGPQHFLAGLILAAGAQRRGGWWAPALLHAAGNAGWLLAAAWA